MASRNVPERQEIEIDDCSGEIKVFRIDSFDYNVVKPENFGEFYSGESYIIEYSYVKWNKPSVLLYYWQGRDCPVLQKGASSKLTTELMNKKKDSMYSDFRVVQNLEPKHFLSLFKDKMIVNSGKLEREDEIMNGTVMYDIRGSKSPYVVATECEVSSNMLYSGAVFILTTKDKAFLWKGKLAEERF